MRRPPSLKRPSRTLAICFALFALAVIFVGFPGPCTFSGIFGDWLARTTVGDWVAYGIVVLPLVGVLASLIWLLTAAVLWLTIPKGDPFR